MSKKVLIISQNFYPEIGSAGNRMKNIYKLLVDEGFEVNVLTTNPTYPNRNIYSDSDYWDDEELNQDISIHRVKVLNRKYSRSLINRLFYYIEITLRMIFSILFNRNKYDIVLTTIPPIFIGIVGLIAKYKYKAKLILDVRDLWPDSLNGVGVFNNPIIMKCFLVIEKFLYKQSDKIIVNSKGFIKPIKDKLRGMEKSITYIPNGARKVELHNLVKLNKSFKVIYAGNIGLAQDEEVLKNLACELYKNGIIFTIIGYGLRHHSLKEFVRDHNLDNVQLLDTMTRTECLKVISEHNVAIVSLKDEPVFETVLPGKIIDYMTCGVPVVGNVSGISKETIENFQVGIVVENNNELINPILKMSSDPSLEQKYSKNARDYVKKEFLWDENINLLKNQITSK